MIVDLGNGQQAELRERLTYGQARDVRRALLAREIDPLALADFDIALVMAYVVNWTVLDDSGKAVSTDAPELAPDDIIQAIAKQALDLWNGKPDPKDGATKSDSTLRALA